MLLVSAAAEEWGVDARSCKVVDGVILSPQFKKLTFGEVAEAAAKLPVPEGRAAQARGAVHADRQGAEAQGHAGQGGRQRRSTAST